MRYFFSLLLCGLFFFNVATAQIKNDAVPYTVSHYTDEDGLPQNSVKDIYKDDLGYIWLVTEAGVVRFNGKEFRVFDKTDLACIRSNRFPYILTVPEQGTYAITEYGRLVELKGGRAFCSTMEEKELNLKKKWNLIPGTVSSWTIGLPQNFFSVTDTFLENSIIPFSQKKIINCTRSNVYFSDNGVVDTVHFRSGANLLGFFAVDEQLYYFDAGVLTHIRPKSAGPVKLTGDILADRSYKGRNSEISFFWNLAMRSTILYCNKSFYDLEILPDGNLSTRLIFADFDISGEQIFTHYYDRTNRRLFLGSAIHGLFVLQEKPFSVLVEKTNPYKAYYAIGVYDSISLATPSGVLFRKHSIVPLTNLIGELRVNQHVIQFDRYGSIWIKDDKTILRSDRSFKSNVRLKFPQQISALYCSADDTSLWVGQQRGGLYQLTISADTAGTPRLVSSGIPTVVFMASESKGKLWIASTKGLFRFDLPARKLVSIDQFKNKHVRSIFVKAPGEIWITTYGDGIFLLRHNKLRQMPIDRNNALAASHCMLLDRYGFFWISTNKGLFKASRADLIAYADNKQAEIFYQYYGKENGLRTNEFNGGCQPCGVELANGTVSFPSLDGIVQIDPGKRLSELPDKPLLVDRVEIDNHQVAPKDTFMLPGKFDNFSVHISTVHFGSPKNLVMSYMLLLDGKPDQWYPVKGNNVISFSSLPSGMYELRIRKINGFGADNYSTATLRFIVPRAFYETAWFKLLVMLTVGLAVFLYTRIRLYFILKRNRMLDLQIARRTRTLTNTLRALKVSEASLRRQTQMQEMLIAAISHDIKSPMKYLTMVSKRMQHQLHKKDYASLEAFNESIQDTSSKVYTILDNLVTYISFQLKGGHIRREAVDILKVVEDKINVFSAIASTNNTILSSNIAPGTYVEGDEALLAVIIHNLIDNAVKFTANGSVDIYTVSESDGRVVLIIRDTGTGIPPELVKWLNTSSEQGLKMETISGHKGMGLMIIKELLTAASAEINVVSGVSGTTIRMDFKKYATDL
jgi:signal transduction histidine kinase